jgi:hypothetical protein
MEGNATLPRLAAALLALLAGPPGCAEEDTPRVRLQVIVESGIPDRVDRVRVIVTAFRTPLGSGGTPATCIPVVRERDLRTPADAPFYVEFVPGATYREGVGFLVQWFRGAELLSTSGALVRSPSSGTTELEARLDAACLERPCADGTRCVALAAGGSECQTNAVAADLLNPAYWDPGRTCDPASEPWPGRDAGTDASDVADAPADASDASDAPADAAD